MDALFLPNKIYWMMDLSKPKEERWSKRVLKKVKANLLSIEERVEYQVVGSEAIREIFWPIYQRTVMQKANYHLDPDLTLEKITVMAKNPDYRLLSFVSKESGEVLGGNVIHLLPEMVKTAYRCYEHTKTNELGIKLLDYYADYKLQEYVQSLGFAQLGRGTMIHPGDGLGLSVYKVRTGGVPIVWEKESTKQYEQKEIEAWVEEKGMLAYYDLPDQEGKYRRLTVYTQQPKVEIEELAKKLFERIGIELRVEEL